MVRRRGRRETRTGPRRRRNCRTRSISAGHWASYPYTLANGRCFQIFCIVGDFSHEGLATVVDTSLSGDPSAAETYNASWESN